MRKIIRIFFVEHLKPALSATLLYQHIGKYGGTAGLYFMIKIIDTEKCWANEFPIVLKATVLKDGCAYGKEFGKCILPHTRRMS